MTRYNEETRDALTRILGELRDRMQTNADEAHDRFLSHSDRYSVAAQRSDAWRIAMQSVADQIDAALNAETGILEYTTVVKADLII